MGGGMLIQKSKRCSHCSPGNWGNYYVPNKLPGLSEPRAYWDLEAVDFSRLSSIGIYWTTPHFVRNDRSTNSAAEMIAASSDSESGTKDLQPKIARPVGLLVSNGDSRFTQDSGSEAEGPGFWRWVSFPSLQTIHGDLFFKLRMTHHRLHAYFRSTNHPHLDFPSLRHIHGKTVLHARSMWLPALQDTGSSAVVECVWA
eukprot:COSAG02_NODE_28092_length_596_cov_1.368209_1_plen_198_part_11